MLRMIDTTFSIHHFDSAVHDASKRAHVALNTCIQKIARLSQVLLNSHVVKILAISSLCCLIVQVHGASVCIAAVACSFGLASIGVWIYLHKRACLQEISLIGSFFRTYVLGKDWYHPIIKNKLYLGAIPLETQNHYFELLNKQIGAVLSVVEPWELDIQVLHQIPVQNWRDTIIHKVIPAIDFFPVTKELLAEGSRFIHEQITQGKIVYVHCKAGVGRSAAVVFAYLTQYEGYKTANDAYEYVRKIRPQVLLSSHQEAVINQMNPLLVN